MTVIATVETPSRWKYSLISANWSAWIVAESLVDFHEVYEWSDDDEDDSYAVRPIAIQFYGYSPIMQDGMLFQIHHGYINSDGNFVEFEADEGDTPEPQHGYSLMIPDSLLNKFIFELLRISQQEANRD